MNTRRLLFPFLFFLLILTITVSLGLGKYPVTTGDVARFLSHTLFGFPSSPENAGLLRNLVLEIRMPRIIAAALIGAALSVSGSAFQAMFINPLVSPGLLGVLAGASFGAALGLMVSKSWFVVEFLSFAFGIIAVFLALGVARIYRANTVFMLILGGIISGALFTSLLSLIKYLADPNDQLPVIVYWLMGGISLVDRNTVYVVAIPILAGVAVMIVLSVYLNALSLGDEEAKALGVPVERIRTVVIIAATLISALTVVLAGMIGWVGLVVPHFTRFLVGPDNRVLVPASALMGAVYLIVVDDLARLLFSIEVPLGILTSLVGIPFFIFVLKNAKKGWM